MPKRDLASAPLVLMQNKQLKIAEGLPLADDAQKGAPELPSEDQYRDRTRLIRGVARGRPRRPGAGPGYGVLVRGALPA